MTDMEIEQSWWHTDKPATTVAVGRVPNRTDGLVSLHVGPQYVLLSPKEVRALYAQLLHLVEDMPWE